MDLAIEATRNHKSASRVDVCVKTLKNPLRKASLKSTKKISKPALSTKYVKERVEFAKMHQDWTICNWERRVFRDETKLNFLCYNGISSCWIYDKKNISACTIKHVVNYSGNSLKLWNYLTIRGVGRLFKIEQTLNVVCYLELLQGDLYTTLIDFNLNEVIFQQDKCICPQI